MSEVTQALDAISRGDARAADELMSLVYDELRRIAAAKMAHEAAGQTLQPTALVHEAWLRLGGGDQPNWQSRAHFFAAAGEAMARIAPNLPPPKTCERCKSIPPKVLAVCNRQNWWRERIPQGAQAISKRSEPGTHSRRARDPRIGTTGEYGSSPCPSGKYVVARPTCRV